MPDTNEQEKVPTREIVTFRLSGQDFCVDIMNIREIRGWSKPTPLPHAPSFVQGLINLRGAVLPIMDLAERLALPAREATERDVIIVTMIDSQLVGLVVDSVSDIITVQEADIQPAPSLGADETHRSIEGIISLEDRMIRVLDLGSVFARTRGEAA